MGTSPYQVFILSGGMVDVVVFSQQRSDGKMSVSVLRKMPDLGFRVAELAVTYSDDAVNRMLEGFQKWAGGEIQQIDLRSQRRGIQRRQTGVDSGWIKLKEHSFFRIFEP